MHGHVWGACGAREVARELLRADWRIQNSENMRETWFKLCVEVAARLRPDRLVPAAVGARLSDGVGCDEVLEIASDLDTDLGTVPPTEG